MHELIENLDERFSISGRWAAVRGYLPFAAFMCGFAFDSITLGRRITKIDLALVSAYAVGSTIAVVLQTREWSDTVDRWLRVGIQFTLGALLSAMVVIYFRSTGQLASLLFVAGLFALMIGNEILHRDEPQRELVWGVYGVNLVMVLNFLLPYAIGSVHWAWLLVCSAIGLGIVHGVRRLFELEWRTVRAATIGIAVLAGLHLLGFIPPVPLVLKNNLACTDFEKKDGEYTCMVDEPGLLQMTGIADPTVTVAGDAVYVLTAVFAPKDIDTEVEHRWYRYVDGDWKAYDTMSFPMRGGREDGWRFWSRKRNITPGEWRVDTALAGGAVLGEVEFTVQERDELASDDVPTRIREAL